MELSLIANTGIHMQAIPLELDFQDKFKMWFHEWYDAEENQWKLEIAEQVNFEAGTLYFSKRELRDKGYLTGGNIATDYTFSDLESDGIKPLADEEGIKEGFSGEIYKMNFTDKHNMLSKFENVWLPAPYFFKRTVKNFKFGPLNWARFKLVPVDEVEGRRRYNVLLAFDTRTHQQADHYNECPVFPDQFEKKMNFELCNNESLLMDFCSPDSRWAYIDEYLMKLAHPDIQRVTQIRGQNVHRLAYIATYVYLINYIASKKLFPIIHLHKDHDVETRNVDMVVDIGNSRTTVLLREENNSLKPERDKPFTQVPKLKLTDYTHPFTTDEEGKLIVNRHGEPFDMRLAFRKVDFGKFGINDSRQFVFPSFVRLGNEANELLHHATLCQDSYETLSTYSSPKRYLWDSKPNKEEWRFLTLPGEPADTILHINGLSEFLRNDGTITPDGDGGTIYRYSRRTLMTFSFLEMLVQARTQINGVEHLDERGNHEVPRHIRRIIITCPTAMSKVEREALITCAKDAVKLLALFDGKDPASMKVDVVPDFKSYSDDESSWYYDEATCSQLVYMYGEIGYKYRGCGDEFFKLYGKTEEGDKQPSITIASLDIGAGTSDLMISKYSYHKDDITRITPDPQFYDSFYFAGDEMLEALIKQIMFMSEKSAFRQQMRDKTFAQFQQAMKDFVGPDYHGQTISDRLLRRDFNLQYSVPLMYHFLELVRTRHKDCVVHYEDVFADCPPNEIILNHFEKRFGFSLTKLDWEFRYDDICEIISKEFEPLLKKIATIMFAYSCDIVLLSGRPASLPPIRDLLLKYYCISPNRLILLNNYYVGDWYPYDNNTGYVVDSKPIVSIGAAIAHYATELSTLNNFIIMTDKLEKNLKSTVNYIEASRDGQPVNYFLSPNKNIGDIVVSTLPTSLKVRQLGMASYPARTLYIIDFNHSKIAQRIADQAIADGNSFSESHINTLVNEMEEEYLKRMPFKVTVEREPDDKETLMISSVTDKNGNDIPVNILDLHIQSLGADEKYWLDSGAFDF